MSDIYNVEEGSVETKGSSSIWSDTSVKLAQCHAKIGEDLLQVGD